MLNDPDAPLVYQYNEEHILKEIKGYIDSTYNRHYAQGKYQATDTIIDAGHGEGFLMGNVHKYWKRYGKKEGKNKEDLLKLIHYAIIMVFLHEEENHTISISFEQDEDEYPTFT